MRRSFRPIGLAALCAAGLGAADLHFEERARDSGIAFKHHANPTPEKYLIETMGGGVGLLDYDNDGFVDIFVTG